MTDARQTVDVLYSFPHVLGGPGIGTTAINQVIGIAAAGARVIVICTSLAGDLPSSVVVRETMRVAGQRVPHRAVGVERAWAYHDWRAARLLAHLRPLPTAVHVWPSSAVRTLAVARQLRVRSFREVPNTHTAHAYAEAEREALITGVGSERGYSHAFSASRLAREEREYELADKLLVPSAVVADTFLDRGFREDHLARHGYGFDDKRFAPAAPRYDEPLKAVFMGRGEPRKGLHYALQAWHASGAGKRGVFRVYGSFVPGYREYIEQWVDDSVQLMGFTDDPAAVLAAADVLILPSVEEGSALVSYEAMGSGCVPVVSSAVGAPVVHGESGLVHNPRDVATLSEQLATLASDPALLERLRVGTISAATDLTWRAAGRRLSALYVS